VERIFATLKFTPQNNKNFPGSGMSLFDRITDTLDRLMSSPSAITPEDELGHAALLEQSSNRIRDTLKAIKQGKLVATSSSTADLSATDEIRYREMLRSRETTNNN
jgi:hypothetical protein